MKIIKLDVMHLKPRWMFLKIHTDNGLVGLGEPVLEGHTTSVEAVLREFEHFLVGQDPLRTEHLWQCLYKGSFYRGGPVIMSAISGVEQALLDIKGKYYGIPVYDMLGGKCRDKVRMYTHIKEVGAVEGNTVKGMVNFAKRRLQNGYTALKYSIIPPIQNIDSKAAFNKHIERFAAVREAIGEQIDLAIDFHGRVSPAMAKRLIKGLEPYYPLFVEEPCLPENVDTMVEIARSTTVPIAAGERLFGKWGFRELLEKQAVAVVQPDICHVGGIFEGRKIAAMSEVYYGAIAPHNPLGPISLAACLHLDVCTPNFLVQEHPGYEDGADLGVGYIKEPFKIENGYIKVSDKPGLGVEIDEEAIKDKVYDGSWETPKVYFPDGSLADW